MAWRRWLATGALLETTAGDAMVVAWTGFLDPRWDAGDRRERDRWARRGFFFHFQNLGKREKEEKRGRDKKEREFCKHFYNFVLD